MVHFNQDQNKVHACQLVDICLSISRFHFNLYFISCNLDVEETRLFTCRTVHGLHFVDCFSMVTYNKLLCSLYFLKVGGLVTLILVRSFWQVHFTGGLFPFRGHTLYGTLCPSDVSSHGPSTPKSIGSSEVAHR